MTRKNWFVRGMRAGIPISLGYFAVSIALGIAAKRAGLTSFQAAIASLLNNASAGEYAGFTLIGEKATYIEVVIMEAVANARYLLMAAAMSQKLADGTSIFQRLLLGFTVTDEIFGVSVAIDGKVSAYFTYGAFVVATFGWTMGTFVGAILGEILPASVVTALGVGLYGMFISVVIPESKRNKVVAALVAISFVASFAFSRLPYISAVPEGVRIIVLTVVISLGAAILFPIKEEKRCE